MSRPHYDSLYVRLQEAGKLDELMIFLDTPDISTKVRPRNRYQTAVGMVTAWGFPCKYGAIWRLYHTKILLWYILKARETAQTAGDLAIVDAGINKAITQRVFELLNQPDLDPTVLVNLARMDFQKKALRLHRQKFKTTLRTRVDASLDAISQEIKNNPKAHAARMALQEAISS